MVEKEVLKAKKLEIQDATQEIGVLPIGSPFGTFDQEEELNLSDVSIEDLDKMVRRDGTARALYNVLTMPIRSAKYSFVPADEGEEEASFIEAMFTNPPNQGGMSTPLSYIISTATKAIRQGFVLWEKVFKIGDLQYIDNNGDLIEKKGALLLKKLAPRPSEQITFKTDENGGLAGAVQRTVYKGKTIEAHYTPEKVLVYTVNKHENSLYGESLLLPAYYHYDKKHKLYYVAHIGYMVNAIPPRHGKHPSNITSQERNAYKQALANIGLNSVITTPVRDKEQPQYEIELLESRRQLADFVPMINHHNAEMTKSILAQFLELGTSGSGAYSLSKDQSDLFLMSLESIMNDIAMTINNYLIPIFIDWNFGTGRYPKFQFEPLADETKQLLRETFTSLVSASSRQVSDDFMLEMEKRVSKEFGFEVDYEELKQKMEQDKEEMKKLRAMGMFTQPKEEEDKEDTEEDTDKELVDGGDLTVSLSELRKEIEEFTKEVAEYEEIIKAREGNN